MDNYNCMRLLPDSVDIYPFEVDSCNCMGLMALYENQLPYYYERGGLLIGG